MISVVEYIKSHNGLPITARNLSEAFGISGFEVRRIVNAARSEGCPICSGQKGYYYSESNDDINRTIDSLEHRMAAMTRAIRGLSKCLGDVE